MKKTFYLLLVMITIPFFVSFKTFSEESFDYRTDVQAYCTKVAELNAEIAQVQVFGLRNDAQPGLILFRTLAVPLDFSEVDFEIQSVVYGPGGFSVLICNNPEGAVSWLRSQKDVTCAEIDTVVLASGIGQETENIAFQSWAAQSMGFGDYIAFSNQYGVGCATVAVIDSGVYSHNLINPKIRGYGYDYVDNDADPTNDLNGHGTRVAGIVADCTRNLPVYIYPIRVLDANAGGKTSNVISAVLEATNAGVDVINLSLSTFAQSGMLENAIRNAVSSGITVVVAAGNYSCDANELTPAKMTDAGVIVVGSAEKDGSRSNFSNFGTSVDLYAYGRGIMCCSRSGGYVSDSGTSMAAPHVSALSAMIYLTHPSVSPAAVEYRIKTAATGSLRIPAADQMIPKDYGFLLDSIRMELGANLNLPAIAQPQTSQEAIMYESTDPAVAEVVDGRLEAKAIGETQIRVRCKGLADLAFTVLVVETDRGEAVLPENLTAIGKKAFYGMKTNSVHIQPGTLSIGDQAFDGGQISFILIPDTITELGENDFSGAVILCENGSLAHEYALNKGFQFLLMQME